MADPRFGYFADPFTAKPVLFPRLKLEHLPGKAVPCPCWTRWLLRFVGVSIHATCRIWWVKNPQYRLLEDVVYVTPGDLTIRVDRGFVFNGASVPWFLWPICPADHPDVLAASSIHDKLCTPPHQCDFKATALIFYTAMRANGYYRWGAFRNWFAVRWFGPRFRGSLK